MLWGHGGDVGLSGSWGGGIWGSLMVVWGLWGGEMGVMGMRNAFGGVLKREIGGGGG